MEDGLGGLVTELLSKEALISVLCWAAAQLFACERRKKERENKKRPKERKKTQFFSLIQRGQQNEVHAMALTVRASSGMFTFSSTSPFSFSHSGTHSQTHTQTLNTQTIKGAKGFTVQLSHCWSKHCSLTRHRQLLLCLTQGLFKTNWFLCPVFRSTISIYSDTR